MFCNISGKRKVHYLFSDVKEMAEEYDMKTDELIRKSSHHFTGSQHMSLLARFHSFTISTVWEGYLSWRLKKLFLVFHHQSESGARKLP